MNHIISIHYIAETFEKIMDGRKPRYFMDIHNVSEVNEAEVRLDLIEGPAHSNDFGTEKNSSTND